MIVPSGREGRVRELRVECPLEKIYDAQRPRTIR